MTKKIKKLCRKDRKRAILTQLNRDVATSGANWKQLLYMRRPYQPLPYAKKDQHGRLLIFQDQAQAYA